MQRYVLVLLLLAGGGLMGQEPYEVLDKIAAVYADVSGLSYTVRYAYYEGLEAKTPSETMEMQVATKGDAYYMAYNDYLLFGDGKQHLVVDHLSKSIRFMALAQRKGGTELAQFREMAEAMGLQLRFFDQKDTALRGLEFTAPEHSRTSIRMVYHPETFYLVSTSIRVDMDPEKAAGYAFNKMRMEVRYVDYRKIEGRFPYRLEDFVTKRGKGEYGGAEEYADYSIL